MLRLFVAALLTAALSLSCTKKGDLSDLVIVKVNSTELTAKEFAGLLTDRIRDLDALSAKDEVLLNRNKQEVIRSFIVQVVTEDWAKDKGLFVRKEEFDAYVAEVKKSYPDDLTFQRSLAEQNLSLEDWKDRVKFSLLQKKVTAELVKDLAKPEDKDLKTYFEGHANLFQQQEQVKLRQVVVDNESNAEMIEDELQKGKPMAELAKKFSIGPESKESGELGWIEKGSFEVFDKAFSLNVGRRSAIIKSPFGFHILEVLGKRPGRKIPFEEAKERIVKALKEEKEQTVVDSWLEGQVRKAKVFKNDKAIDAIRVETLLAD